MDTLRTTDLLTVVIPVYNEGAALDANLPPLLAALGAIDQTRVHVLLVDDGSTDGSRDWLQRFSEASAHVDLLCLTRNFGKEAAILAGLRHAQGDAVVVMDSDLQHPPELVASMLALWRQGMDVVDACKASRGAESRLSATLARTFYRLFGWMAGIDIHNSADFKLLDRKVVDAYCALPERKRFFRGLTAWMGFPSARIYFDVPERKHGRSAWSRLRLLRLSLDALTGFSTSALHLITALGLLTLVLSVVIGGIAIYHKLAGVAVSGFTTVILVLLLLGSCIMVGLGVVGIYLEQIFTEIKGRPVFLVDARNSRLRTKP